MTQEKRIPLAWTARWRRIRLHVLPVVCFLLAVVACGWLWQRQESTLRSVGEVDTLRIDVTSPITGMVLALPHETGGQWNLYDHVLAGDVIATIDNPQLDTAGQAAAESGAEPLKIVAPISGTLVDVGCWPGQTVPQGGLIATIAADHGRHVVSYIPENSPITPRPGMLVTLLARDAGTTRYLSQIEEVGGQIERIPDHQREGSNAAGRGLPVRIKLPADLSLRPGAEVSVVYHQDDFGVPSQVE
jgi:multidrug resistance efflux pump